MIRVLLVTTWKKACGIADHAAALKAAVEAADAEIEITPDAEALDPYRCLYKSDWVSARPDIVHLNYQAALHSRWQVEQIQKMQALGAKVLVTYHDSGVPNSDQCRAICGAADYFVLHEPYDDLPEHGEYLRMGVPDWSGYPVTYDWAIGSWSAGRPILGTLGFPFPWKCYDELARVTARAGWALLLIAPEATEEQQRHWRQLNPHTWISQAFMPRPVQYLAGCDATAFTYVTHNTGQSGAILQGIAARKPVIALSTCRQMRALYLDPLGRETIRWCETFEEVEATLRRLPIQRVDPGIVALAEQESWAKVGARYADIYRRLCSH